MLKPYKSLFSENSVETDAYEEMDRVFASLEDQFTPEQYEDFRDKIKFCTSEEEAKTITDMMKSAVLQKKLDFLKKRK